MFAGRSTTGAVDGHSCALVHRQKYSPFPHFAEVLSVSTELAMYALIVFVMHVALLASVKSTSAWSYCCLGSLHRYRESRHSQSALQVPDGRHARQLSIPAEPDAHLSRVRPRALGYRYLLKNVLNALRTA